VPTLQILLIARRVDFSENLARRGPDELREGGTIDVGINSHGFVGRKRLEPFDKTLYGQA
jgi:hypothetical protein